MPCIRLVYTDRDGVRITGSFAKIDGAHRIMFDVDTPTDGLRRQMEAAERAVMASSVAAGWLDSYDALRHRTPCILQRYGKFICRVSYDSMARGMFPPTVFDIKAGTRVRSMTLRADECVCLPDGTVQPSWVLTDIVLARPGIDDDA